MDNIAMERALAHFKTLLEEQSARVERMENAEPPVDFSKKEKIVIGVCDGDGIVWIPFVAVRDGVLHDAADGSPCVGISFDAACRTPRA